MAKDMYGKPPPPPIKSIFSSPPPDYKLTNTRGNSGWFDELTKPVSPTTPPSSPNNSSYPQRKPRGW